MISKLSVCRYICVLSAIVLAACGNSPTETIHDATATSVPSLTMTITPVPSLASASATSTIAPVTLTPTSPYPISSAPDGLHMAYVLDGNLYFQDGSQPPVQLTNSGEDWRPLFFSGDGENLFFFRGIIPYELYSINVEKNQEQALVTNSLLQALGMGFDESTAICNPTLVPGVQLLLFETCAYPYPDNLYVTSENSDLLSVNVETREIARLLSSGQAAEYYVSPDGEKIAIDSIGRIDVIGINGKVIRRNLLTYTPSEPIFLPPYIYWTSDSDELIVLQPVPTFYDTSGGPPAYTVWRYLLDTGLGIQIALDPLPMAHDPARVSPDGNLIVYNNYEETPLFIGNLREGDAQIYEPDGAYAFFDWSPNSTYFIYEIATGRDLYVGSFTDPPVRIGNGHFAGWLDASRYLYFSDNTLVMGEVGAEATTILADIPSALFPSNPHRFIFTSISK